MLKNEDIICISSIDWDFIWQGHQEIMTRLARNGNRVLFIENTGVRVPTLKDAGRIKKRFANWRKGVYGIRKIEDGLYVYSPLVLPFPYLKIARFVNKKLMFSVLFKWLKVVGFREPIVWTFLPTGLSLDLINEIEPKILIYYCIDSFQASSKDAQKIKFSEKLLLKKADLVFVTSIELSDYCSQYNKNVHYFPFGVNIDNFSRVLHTKDATPGDIAGIRRPIAGYIGGIHKWIDFDLVRYIALENRDVSFVFCGPIQTDISKIKDLPNVVLLGQKETEKLPRYVKEFDLGLIPYKITDYTRNVYPTKLNEYLSLGKIVLSTELPEITKFNRENNYVVRIASSKESFSKSIKQTLLEPPNKATESSYVEVAKKHSWTNKIKNMSSLIENMILMKTGEREKKWKGNILNLYRATRRKILPLAIAAAIGYFGLFHTPLLWFLAKPLAVGDTYKKADVVVALGGGVGESGKVGEGHAERVDSAVKLYRRGFAPKIMYSSGYRYIMKEAEVMKALSVFMGVKEKDIIIDDTPVNTYEMIIDLKKLADRNNWEDIIVISSPYHLLRVKLLCERYLKDANVYVVPVEKSSFYRHGSVVKLSQINGIIHEYIAILYYMIKGYI